MEIWDEQVPGSKLYTFLRYPMLHDVQYSTKLLMKVHPSMTCPAQPATNG